MIACLYSSVVEHCSRKAGVVSSNLTGGCFFWIEYRYIFIMAGKHDYITFLFYYITVRLNIKYCIYHTTCVDKVEVHFLGLHKCRENNRFYRDLNSDHRIQSAEC